MDGDLDAQFHQRMVEIYQRATNECSYRPTYFLRMVQDHGGFEAARKLLHASRVSDGFTTLWEKGRLDLSVEAVVLQAPWRDSSPVKNSLLLRSG